MKNPIFLTICFLLFTATLGAAPAEKMQMQKTSIAILENGSPINHTVTIRYEKNTQAVIRNLELLFLKFDRETNTGNVLLLKGSVQNRLSRDLTNAQVTVSYFDKDGELLSSKKSDILPHRINTNNNSGRFLVNTAYSEKISLIEITMDWQGKTE